MTPRPSRRRQTPGVQFHDMFGVWIAGSGGLDSVIDGVGGSATNANPTTMVDVDVRELPEFVP